LTLVAALLIACFTVITFAKDPDDVTVINLDTKWKYLDDDTDPASGKGSLTAWTEPGFDDSGWKTGTGSFGSKNGHVAEINGRTPKQHLNFYRSDGTGNVIPSYFFRTTFNVANASEYNKLVITAAADDSMAIYVNGTIVVDTRNTKEANTNIYYSSGTNYNYYAICFKPEDNVLRDGVNTVAVELHNDREKSSDVYFEISRMTLICEEVAEFAVAEQRIMSPGADQTKRSLAWFSSIADAGEVRLTKAENVQNGVFPSEYDSFSATSTPEKIYRDMRYVKKATITGLEENTRYAYVIAAGGHVSDIYYFNVGSFGNFEFVYITDPQLQEPEEGPLWHDSLDKIVNNLGVELIVCAGDQVSTSDDSELYAEFITDTLSGVTFAPSVGPGHESPSVLYAEHYNLPNLSTSYGVSNPSANYYYVYNNVLFMHLNSADKEAYKNGEHAEFVENTMKANPDVDWSIVVMHYSLYTTGKYGNDSTMISYRNALAPKLTELGVDVVLSGHDHVYTRTHLMDGLEVSDDIIVKNVAYQPEGTLYICAGSSTGTKYYSKTVNDAPYAAVESYKRKAAVKFEVTETTLKFTSYYLDDMSSFDTLTISKEAHVCELKSVKEKAATCRATGKLAYYTCVCGKNFEDANATVAIANIETWGIIPTDPDAHKGPKATCTQKAECIYCGEEYGEYADHDFGSAWISNADGHRQKCSCGYNTDLEPHKDEDSDNVCDVCLRHVHDYGLSYKNDSQKHWQECSCGNVINSGSHKNSNNDGKCDTCGCDFEHVHGYSSFYGYDERAHWNECSCGYKVNVATHRDSNADSVCDVCENVIPVHTHSFSSDFSSSENAHWRLCSCGEKEIAPHADGNSDGLCDACQRDIGASNSSVGVIIAIVAGSVVAVAAIGFVLFKFVIKRKIK
jgi:3',5'-cyclic AMP phosphodiesterase CpdA